MMKDEESKATEPSSVSSLLVSDPTASLQPTVVKDFQVFINLVDFCRCFDVSVLLVLHLN